MPQLLRHPIAAVRRLPPSLRWLACGLMPAWYPLAAAIYGVAFAVFGLLALYWLVSRYLLWLLVPALLSATLQLDYGYGLVLGIAATIVVNQLAHRFAVRYLRPGSTLRELLIIRAGRFTPSLRREEAMPPPFRLPMNPATGLPMIEGSDLDLAGNLYGFDSVSVAPDPMGKAT